MLKRNLFLGLLFCSIFSSPSSEAAETRILTATGNGMTGHFYLQTTPDGKLSALRYESYNSKGALQNNITHSVEAIRNGVVLYQELRVNVIQLSAPKLDVVHGGRVNLNLLHQYFFTQPNDFRLFPMELVFERDDRGHWVVRADLKTGRETFDSITLHKRVKGRGIETMDLSISKRALTSIHLGDLESI